MKTIKSGDTTVNFFKDKNNFCHVEVIIGDNFIMSLKNMDRDICNYFFVRMKSISKEREITREDLENISLEISLYFGDYDGYSDYFKDVNNVRPHMSQDEFNALCVETRVKVQEALANWKKEA